MLLKIDRKCFDTRDEAFNFAATFGGDTPLKSLISIVRSVGHEHHSLWIDVCHLYGTGMHNDVSVRTSHRRTTRGIVRTWPRGIGAKKCLAVGVASSLTYGDSRHGSEYSENCLNERFSGRALFFETCHSYSRRKTCKL